MWGVTSDGKYRDPQDHGAGHYLRYTNTKKDAVLHSMHVGLHRRSTVHCMCSEHKDKTLSLIHI